MLSAVLAALPSPPPLPPVCTCTYSAMTGASGEGSRSPGEPPSPSSFRSGKASLADFEILAVIGRGGYGKVMQVRLRGSNEVYAMKSLRKKDLVSRKQVWTPPPPQIFFLFFFATECCLHTLDCVRKDFMAWSDFCCWASIYPPDFPHHPPLLSSVGSKNHGGAEHSQHH